MRAVVVPEFGSPDVLEIRDAPRPEPVFTEVLVRVHAAGINPIDSKTREGRGVASILGQPPFAVGWDVSGIVDVVPFGINTFVPGDRVLGLPRFPRQAGTFADYVAGPARHFVKMPDSMDFVTAAALPLAGSTAWQTVYEAASITAGQRVLIHGAAGGVGHLALQICKAAGAKVITSDSGTKDEFLTSLGADQVIDYTTTRFEDILGADQVDAVIDLVGGEVSYRSLNVLKPGGVIVSVPSGQKPGLRAAAAVSGHRVADIIVDPYGPTLQALVDLWEEGLLRVEIAGTFDLTEVVAAHRSAESGSSPGKTVLTMAHDNEGA